MKSLVDYRTDSSASNSDGDGDSDEPKTKTTKLSLMKEAVKRTMLPSASQLLGTKQRRKSEEINVDDDPTKHNGRIRSFAHERGNWATYIYIPVDSSILEDLQTHFITQLSNEIDLQLPNDELHISLSKTVILQYHLIKSFVQTLNTALANCVSFNASLLRLKIYTNEERTRTFIAMEVNEVFREKMDQLLKQVDVVMSEYRLATFYKPASFHVSFLWCLGDQRNALQTHLPKLQTMLSKHIEHELLDLTINELRCKSGNKEFNFKLK